MKASIKLRDGERPLVRAKLPLNFLGVPLMSGLSLGSTRELALHMGTLFEAGPSCRLTFRPNDGESPLSVMIKTGFGLWGSPAEAPLIMAAEFKLSSRGNPSFAVQVKPRLGSFSLRKNAFSPCMIPAKVSKEGEDFAIKNMNQDEQPAFLENSKGDSGSVHGLGSSSVGEVMPSELVNYTFKIDSKCIERKAVSSPPSSEGSSVVLVSSQEDGEEEEQHHFRQHEGKICHVEKSIEDVNQLHVNTGDPNVSNTSSPALKELTSRGMEFGRWNLIAHTALPLGRHAVGKLRWRVTMPSDFLSRLQSESEFFSLKKFPVLVMDKLSVECCEDPAKGRHPTGLNYENEVMAGLIREPENSELAKVATMCSSMKRQLHLLHVENRVLKKTMEDMKSELGNGKKGRLSPYMVMDEDLEKQMFKTQGRKDDQQQNPNTVLNSGESGMKVAPDFEIKGLESLGKEEIQLSS